MQSKRCHAYESISLCVLDFQVQKIISLASKGPNTTPNVMNQTAHAPAPTIFVAPIKMAGSTNSRTKRQESIIPVPMLLNSGVLPSGTSHSVASSGGGLRMNSDAADSKAAVQLVLASQQEASKILSAAFGSESAGTTMPKGNLGSLVHDSHHYSEYAYLHDKCYRQRQILPL